MARALAKQPDERYDSCAELIDAVRRALEVGEPCAESVAVIASSIRAWA